MRKLLKSLLCIGVLLGTGGMLAGCHGSQGMADFTVPEELDSSRTFQLTFWAKNDTNKTQTKIYEKAIADFEALYPNIDVTIRLYTDYGKIYNDVITNIATNTTPNVCITYPDHIATYLTGANTVVPLEGLFADEKYGLGGSEVKFDAPSQQEIAPQFLNECAFAEHYYAIPFMRSTEACYINKTYVEQLGFTVPDVLTWDFMFEVAEAAMAKNADGTFAVNGQKVMIPIIYKSTDNMMIQMLKQKNAGYSDAEGNILIFNDTTKELLFEIASHAKTGAFSTFKISSYPANFLNAGQCIFAIDSTAGATWMGSDAPLSDIAEDKIVHFETSVRPVPQFDTEHPQMISQGPSICIFNKRDPQEVLASWLFAQYLLTNDVQIAYSQTEGYVPVTLKAQQTPEYQDYLSKKGSDNTDHYTIKIQASELLLNHLDDTFVTPVFNGSTSLRDAAGQMIENVTKSVRRKETVDDAYIEELYGSVTSLYHLDQIHSSSGSAGELGELPTESRVLLITLVAIWVCLGIGYGVHLKRTKKV
ncbi:MAG: extracellular solute-binding protein [Solobacterium sp.]|nr:extracellular solute-binding protein [Solobacterium sp.]